MSYPVEYICNTTKLKCCECSPCCEHRKEIFNMDDKRERRKYKILNVEHSGRRGIRYESIKDPKYDGLIGSIIETENIENVKLFNEIKWDFVENKPAWYDYDWWKTSPVIEIYLDLENHYVIETVNIIYVLEKVFGESV